MPNANATSQLTAPVRLRALLAELTGDAVVRRLWRRTPALALAERRLAVPAPPGPLPVRLVGLSAFVEDDDLLGRGAGDHRPEPGETASAAPDDVGLLLAFAWARPLALVHGPEAQAEQVAHRLRRGGWTALLGPTAFTPAPDGTRGGFVDAAARTWPARAGGGGWRSVLVSPNRDVTVAAWLAMLFGWDDWLGVLLGYPSCCATAFPARWASARRTHGGDVARAALDDPRPADGRRPPPLMRWEANAFVRVLGAALPLHFPCSLMCPRTIAGTRWHLELLRTLDARRARHTEALLMAPVALGPDGETVALVGATPTGAGRVRYDPGAVRSSQPAGALTAEILQRDSVTDADVTSWGSRLVLVESSSPTREHDDALPLLALA